MENRVPLQTNGVISLANAQLYRSAVTGTRTVSKPLLRVLEPLLGGLIGVVAKLLRLLHLQKQLFLLAKQLCRRHTANINSPEISDLIRQTIVHSSNTSMGQHASLGLTRIDDYNDA